MKRIAILSDTHGLLRQEVKEELKQADVIIHGGDINTAEIVEELKGYAPLYIVRGNNDKEWANGLPTTESFAIEGVNFFLIHNKKEIEAALPNVNVVVYGHSHKYEEKEVEGVLWLNPGSCGKRRFDLEITMCRMWIEEGSYRVEKILLNGDVVKVRKN